MGKNTEKLSKALLVLGLKFDEHTPNITIYGRMAERGYTWDGLEWCANRKTILLSYPVQIRVMGNSYEDTSAMAALIQADLREHGLLCEAKPPTQNYSSPGWRTYIDVE